jgi:hypothetical protein
MDRTRSGPVPVARDGAASDFGGSGYGAGDAELEADSLVGSGSRLVSHRGEEGVEDQHSRGGTKRMGMCSCGLAASTHGAHRIADGVRAANQQPRLSEGGKHRTVAPMCHFRHVSTFNKRTNKPMHRRPRRRPHQWKHLSRGPSDRNRSWANPGAAENPLADLSRPDVAGFDRICPLPNLRPRARSARRPLAVDTVDPATVRNVAGCGGVP